MEEVTQLFPPLKLCPSERTSARKAGDGVDGSAVIPSGPEGVEVVADRLGLGAGSEHPMAKVRAVRRMPSFTQREYTRPRTTETSHSDVRFVS